VAVQNFFNRIRETIYGNVQTQKKAHYRTGHLLAKIEGMTPAMDQEHVVRKNGSRRHQSCLKGGGHTCVHNGRKLFRST